LALLTVDAMTTLAFVLMTVTLVGLGMIWRQSPLGLNLVPLGIALLAVMQLFFDGYNPNLLSVYLVILGLVVVGGWRLTHRNRLVPQTRHGLMISFGIFGTALGLLALFLGVRATLYQNLPPADLSQMTWCEAFETAHRKLSHQYAFGDWKQIDWDVLYAEFAPQIATAEAGQNRQAYYQALLSYTASIPDGHVWLEGDDFGARQAAIGAGYGLEILSLDDGRVLVVDITPGGAAEGTGILWGAEILTWNDQPIPNALESVPILWPLRRGAPATLEGQRLAQLRLLVRAPEETTASVRFRNPGDSQIQEVFLAAVQDGVVTQYGNWETSLPPVEPGLILPGGIGYIKINNEHEDSDHPPEKIFEEAIQTFIEAQVTGIILDVRGNRGGDDQLVPRFVGHFFTQRGFYEKATLYFQPFNTFIPHPPDLCIEPLEPYFDGPVLVLIDNTTFSSGEGIALAIASLPQGEVIGFYGTYGSFGMTGGKIYLPEGLTLHFPDGQSLNGQGVIQLDSDHSLQGGIAPTIRVPMTAEAARVIFVDGEDFLLDYAIRYLQNK
jgi:carboxyl-terminal processing protease